MTGFIACVEDIFCLFKRNGNKLSKTSAILNFSFDIKRQGDCAKFLENAVQRERWIKRKAGGSSMDITQESLAIKGPKNKKQIGRIGKGDKIYIEDYAVTYLNQIARAPETQTGFAGLFGTCREIEGVKEYYIYAAVYQEATQILEGGLPREAVQKIMRQRADMFVEYFFLGWAFILKESGGTMWESCYRSRLETLMGKPELLMTLRCNTCEEHFYLYPTEMPKETEGYFIFYDKNDAMQNFLIDWHGINHKDKCDEEGDNVAESCRNYYKEKKAARLRTRLAGVLLTAAVLLLIFSAGVLVQNLNHYEKMQEVGQTIDEVVVNHEEAEQMDEDILLNDAEAEQMNEEVMLNDVEEEQMKEEVILSDEEAEEINEEMILNNIEPEQITEEITADVTEEVVLNVETELDEQYVTYEVSKGDTLYGICVEFYGNLSRVQEICQLNNIENMDNILYGEKILLPQ